MSTLFGTLPTLILLRISASQQLVVLKWLNLLLTKLAKMDKMLTYLRIYNLSLYLSIL